MTQRHRPQTTRSRLLDQLKKISPTTDLSPAQASAVFEFVDALRDRLWLLYGQQIQQLMRDERAATSSIASADIPDGEPPF